MFLFLSKLLSQLIYPLNLALCGFAIGGLLLAQRRRAGVTADGVGRPGSGRRRRVPRILTSGGFWIFSSLAWLWSTPAFSKFFCSTLEHRYPPVSVDTLPQAGAIVVLGGCISPPSLPLRIYADMNACSSRLWHAARLYRAGKAPVVVVTSLTNDAVAMQEFLVEMGVPATAIQVERRSHTTYENALFTRQLLEDLPVQAPAGSSAEHDGKTKPAQRPRILLVTSAQHMRRAEMIFKRMGFDVIPAATNYEVAGEMDPMPHFPWLPDAGALELSTAAFKEYIGYLVYRQRKV